MGTYHHIRENKVKIIFKGNIRTCGRCHGEQQVCPGKGFASECTSERVTLEHHMRRLQAKKERLRNSDKHNPSLKGYERYNARESDFSPLPGAAEVTEQFNREKSKVPPPLGDGEEAVMPPPLMSGDGLETMIPPSLMDEDGLEAMMPPSLMDGDKAETMMPPPLSWVEMDEKP